MRGRGVTGLDDVVRVSAQEGRDGLAGGLIVLDEQDARRPRARRSWRPSIGHGAVSAPRSGTAIGRSTSTASPPSSLRRAVDPSRPSPRRAPGRPPGRSRSRVASPRPCEARGRTSRTGAAWLRAGTPGPPSSTTIRTRSLAASRGAEIRIGAPGPAYLAALSIVLASTWPMRTSSTRIGGRSGGTSTVDGSVAERGRRAADRLGDDVAHGRTTRLGRSSPASTRLMSSRFVTSRLSHSASRSIEAAISRRCVAAANRCLDP